jgi:gluconate 2-dehydrogenase gamma chain
MNRREFLQCAALLVAGSAASPWALSVEQRTFLAARPDYVDSAPLQFFSAIQRAAVKSAADHVIPATDTPGAVAAGAERFVELMVADWFNEDERAAFMTGLEDLQARSQGNFARLSFDEQLALLETLEDQASDSNWFQLGNTLRIWDSEAPFICQFKELVVLGFMLSSTGTAQFLRPNPMGSFDGDIPLHEDDAAYASPWTLRVIAKEI